MGEPAVNVDHVSKHFRVYSDRNQSLKQTLLSGRRSRHEDNRLGPREPRCHDAGMIDELVPEGGLRAWLVVVSSWLLLFPSFGFMISIGTLQDYWSQHQLSQYTARDIGWIPSVFVYLSLALGIGANAAIFSLFDQMLLRPLPVQEPERLVNLLAPGPDSGRKSGDHADAASRSAGIRPRSPIHAA